MQRLERWVDGHRRATTLGLFTLTFGLVGLTLDDPGITWDEPAYFISAELEVEWVRMLLSQPSEALDRDVVYEMWDWDHYHNPHPPLYKEAMALTWWGTRGAFGELIGFRLAPALLFAGLIALVFRWGAAAWGGVGGLASALSVLLMPRIFGHAHIGATETPLIAFWSAASAAGWWAIERQRREAWFLVGVAWGLATGTKFTGLLAVAPLTAWGLWRDPRAMARGLPVAALVGAALFFLLNPMLWFDPVFFMRRWLWESLHRSDYIRIATMYLGRVYDFSVPWHHVFVLTAATIPLGILSLAGMGAAAGARRADPLVLLCLTTVAFLWIVMLHPGAPQHDGVRMFISLFPFVGLLAGYGMRFAWAAAGRARGLIAGLVFIPAAMQLALVHPYQLAYYSEIVGGIRGARALGFETTYWMDAFNSPVLDWMNRNLPEGARVWVLGEPLALKVQQGYGELRPDMRFVGTPAEADWALVQMRQGILGPDVLEHLAHARPVYQLELQGVPLVGIYPIEEFDPRVKESRE